LRKRFYILFVARDGNGQLRKIEIPTYYLYALIAGAVISILSLTGIVGSYARMLVKVSHFNELRAEKEALTQRYSKLEQAEHEKDVQVASLGSLASEVSALYGLKPDPILTSTTGTDFRDEQVNVSVDQLYALRSSALSGATTIGMSLGTRRTLTLTDWLRASAAPAVWPVMGRITGSFGERIDPFNGEGAFHRGVDISTPYGEAVIAPADGDIVFADLMNGYGRTVIIEHGHRLTTLYGHLSSFHVVTGQPVHRGDVIGYVGLSGRSTGPHLHYEVRINDIPVNPHKYLRVTLAHEGGFALGS
jgi:murein DD-endopeptidase MepM/ murein hydrolase activator NlpD